QDQVAVGMDGTGIQPLHIQFFDGGKGFRGVALVEDLFELAIADGVENQAVLITQDLFLLLIAKTAPGHLVGVGSGALADAAPAHEDLGLQEQLSLTGFALHVIDGITVLYIGIEAENHPLLMMASSRFAFPLKEL